MRAGARTRDTRRHAHERRARPDGPPAALPAPGWPCASPSPRHHSPGTPAARAPRTARRCAGAAGGGRPYVRPARRPGGRPVPCRRAFANGAACRKPARRAASSWPLSRSRWRCSRSRSRTNSLRPFGPLQLLAPPRVLLQQLIAVQAVGRRALSGHAAVMPEPEIKYKGDIFERPALRREPAKQRPRNFAPDGTRRKRTDVAGRPSQ